MYLTHFGLTQLPFSMTPDPRFFFAGNKRGEILEALIYAVLQGDGIVKVTGEVGCGKTMLCRMLENRLPESVEVIYLVNPTLTREQVIYTIGGELELPISGKRVDEVIRMLHADLIGKHIAGKQVVLLVEEAQAMSLQTLEEIRLFSNLETAHHKLLQIVLFGQPELDEHLDIPKMRQLKERITNSFTVPPLTSATLPDFLMFRLNAAGCQETTLFSSEAIDLIDRVSEGIVRRVSILADKSLLAAYTDNATTVSSKHVRAAIEDSEFPKGALRLFNRKRVATVTAGCAAVMLLVALGYNSRAAILPMLSPRLSAKLTKPATNVTKAGPAAVAKVAAVSPAVAAIAPVTTPVPEPIPAAAALTPAPTMATITLEQRLQITDLWLKQQSPERYSIQIALVADQTEIARFLHKMASETGLQEVYVYTAKKTNSPHFGIVVGSYATRAEAVDTLNQITTRWGYHPQLRTIGGIKRELAAQSALLPDA